MNHVTPKALAVNPIRMDMVVSVVQVAAINHAIATRTTACRNIRTIAMAELQAETTDIDTLRLALVAIAQQADGALKP